MMNYDHPSLASGLQASQLKEYTITMNSLLTANPTHNFSPFPSHEIQPKVSVNPISRVLPFPPLLGFLIQKVSGMRTRKSDWLRDKDYHPSTATPP